MSLIKALASYRWPLVAYIAHVLQERLLASIAVCCADEDDLHAMGASLVLEQHAALNADARDIEQSTSGRHP